jgi:MFS family permease
VGLVKNYPALLACRFLLGLAEAGLFPGMMTLPVPLHYQGTDIVQGVNYYLSCWYKRSELGFRAALFFSAAALAGSFGGLLAAAIALMDGIGGLNGWAWIFIIEVSEHT